MKRSFDRVADRYDATRGGEARGRAIAQDLHPYFTEQNPLLEIGIGTGVVANGLHELGRSVVGVDIGIEMAKRATERIGRRIAVGDAEWLPIGSCMVTNVYTVWVLQLLDIDAVLREAARVLKPGGRYVVSQTSDLEPNALQQITTRLRRELGQAARDAKFEAHSLAARAEGVGFRLIYEGWGSLQRFELRPDEVATNIETRVHSFLWDLDDERWAKIVEPAIAELRALPDAHRPVRCGSRAQVVVFER